MSSSSDLVPPGWEGNVVSSPESIPPGWEATASRSPETLPPGLENLTFLPSPPQENPAGSLPSPPVPVLHVPEQVRPFLSPPTPSPFPHGLEETASRSPETLPPGCENLTSLPSPAQENPAGSQPSPPVPVLEEEQVRSILTPTTPSPLQPQESQNHVRASPVMPLEKNQCPSQERERSSTPPHPTQTQRRLVASNNVPSPLKESPVPLHSDSQTPQENLWALHPPPPQPISEHWLNCLEISQETSSAYYESSYNHDWSKWKHQKIDAQFHLVDGTLAQSPKEHSLKARSYTVSCTTLGLRFLYCKGFRLDDEMLYINWKTLIFIH
ncbi:hypothetical protein AXF42_Ash007451 [Apostasia shenzhenica]|uniref:Uncharacterized protein n=1 Tax=Apostasia shenzhenica TaxID=1088818 RepID=A0A2I0BA83_9ASPA|nr:hypothetical protein AXF42_Ash007451 [Apostasia shenzhenica]